MNIPPQFVKDIASMPDSLRRLVEAELAAGNEIIEVGHSFPAPPVGCYVKLARPVSSQPRASTEGIDFYDRNSSIYSGEFADPARYFFVLEPPHPPPPEPDMDAIRAAVQPQGQPLMRPLIFSRKTGEPVAGSALERFRSSMIIDYEKWHDGIGYDLEIIHTATPEELLQIEDMLISRPVSDWRDVEALAAIDSPRARVVLKKTLRNADHQVRNAVVSYAPHLVSDRERSASLVAALEDAEIYGGLTEALDQAESFHPPEVVDALFSGLLKRDGETAVHFAAMLTFLHGKATTSFDWDQRPFFLQFNTENKTDRRRCFRELCERIGVDADKMLKRYGV
jgi:hypothetical protein